VFLVGGTRRSSGDIHNLCSATRTPCTSASIETAAARSLIKGDTWRGAGVTSSSTPRCARKAAHRVETPCARAASATKARTAARFYEGRVTRIHLLWCSSVVGWLELVVGGPARSSNRLYLVQTLLRAQHADLATL
jgi:hypothetical protein